MRVRLHGTADETNRILAVLRAVLDIREISRAYPDRPPSPLQRTYVEATPLAEKGEQR